VVVSLSAEQLLSRLLKKLLGTAAYGGRHGRTAVRPCGASRMWHDRRRRWTRHSFSQSGMTVRREIIHHAVIVHVHAQRLAHGRRPAAHRLPSPRAVAAGDIFTFHRRHPPHVAAAHLWVPTAAGAHLSAKFSPHQLFPQHSFLPQYVLPEKGLFPHSHLVCRRHHVPRGRRRLFVNERRRLSVNERRRLVEGGRRLHVRRRPSCFPSAPNNPEVPDRLLIDLFNKNNDGKVIAIDEQHRHNSFAGFYTLAKRWSREARVKRRGIIKGTGT
jgi:hypothetical protein